MGFNSTIDRHMAIPLMYIGILIMYVCMWERTSRKTMTFVSRCAFYSTCIDHKRASLVLDKQLESRTAEKWTCEILSCPMWTVSTFHVSIDKFNFYLYRQKASFLSSKAF